MENLTDARVLSGIAGFFVLALATPILFAVLSVILLPSFIGAVELLEGMFLSIPVGLYGLWVFPSWLCVALTGALALVTLVPRGVVGRLVFTCAFSGTAVVWSLLVQGFPQHRLMLAGAAAIASLLASQFKKRLYTGVT
jgi:hypothetical protein